MELALRQGEEREEQPGHLRSDREEQQVLPPSGRHQLQDSIQYVFPQVPSRRLDIRAGTDDVEMTILQRSWRPR